MWRWGFCLFFLASASGKGANSECADRLPVLRQQLAAILPSVPSFLHVNGQGVSVPVLLFNRTTFSRIEPFLSQTYSTAIEFWNYKGFATKDHGLLGLGRRLIDVNPVDRRREGRYGYSWESTVRWRQLATYLEGRRAGFEQKKPNAAQIAQVVFVPERRDDFDAIEVYHRLRRGAFFVTDQRVDSNPCRRLGPEYHLQAAENCFEFGTGAFNPVHLAQLRHLLAEFGVRDADALLAEPKVLSFLRQFREELLAIPLEDPTLSMDPERERGLLGPQLLWKDRYREWLAPWTEGLTLQQRDRFSRLVFGYAAFREFGRAVGALDLTGARVPVMQNGKEVARINDFLNVSNPRVLMVLIYDANVREEDFVRERYRAQGHVHRFP